LAERQHGVVGRCQILDAGVGRRVVERRLEAGRLHVVQRGVYAVGHRVLTREGQWMAAVLAAGPRAALSHRSAAALWMVRSSTELEVTVPTGRARPGIMIHRALVPADELTTQRGIPVTTVPRTLFDLAGNLPRHQVERAINEAEVRRLADPLSLADLLDRYPRRLGAPAIRSILHDGVTVTRSELEARFLSFLRKCGLPRPETNTRLHVAGRWIECDCLWRERGLIVELDGWAAHGTAAAFERDRARDRILQAHGWRLARVTWRQLRDDGRAVAYDLSALLSSSRDTAPSRSTSQASSCS
jgi:very-short-patch-repair endonuclease